MKKLKGINFSAFVLGSRSNYCIDKEVSTITSLQRMNDACITKIKSPNGCIFYQKKKKIDCEAIRDIEDLRKEGLTNKACPYYLSRDLLSSTQIVFMPYNMLLQESTRESFGIDLDDSIVILDEAHNLIDAINQMYTTVVTFENIMNAENSLNSYFTKYEKKFSGKTKMYLKQLQMILNAFVKYDKKSQESVITANSLLNQLNISHINVFKIKSFVDESGLSNKLIGFNDKNNLKSEFANISPIQDLLDFCLSLMNSDSDGRVFIENNSFKYVNLNPSIAFEPLVARCKSIILAGGTMDPVESFVDQLMPNLDRSRFGLFSCGHIIPKENLIVTVIEKGPTSKPLILNYETKYRLDVIDELGRALLNIIQVIPFGCVVFLPSYNTLESVLQRWEQIGILNKISGKKKIFKEPTEGSNVTNLLRDYNRTINLIQQKPDASHITGCILFSVVGGKMSEGINFSDDMGRAVIMIGMPYANLQSQQLQEYLLYADKSAPKGKMTPKRTELYENMCMKAVNQSIGRAIRHINDYAAIIFLDSRYTQKSIVSKIPKWISNQLVPNHNFGPCFTSISKVIAAAFLI
ncbi:DNA repair helicase [Rozella allomycis CSF55]|uniref:ATP-dependent DNA helicase CHL1 n=1 Tax=Rozella allomycis (strain CSF55) TaxID=988480 RepID=A0A4P9YKX4_ROZAC|nr:DNA repair helicase [Rozella allomycis CSF55]